MKNSKITRKITQGMYILTTVGGGCIVDAVARVGGTEQPLIAVSVSKLITLINYWRIMIDLLYRC